MIDRFFDHDRRGRNECGQTLVLVTVFFTVLLIFIGVIVDGGMFYVQKRNAQGDADAAVMAAVRELPRNRAGAIAIAREYAQTRNTAGTVAQAITVSGDNTSITVTTQVSGNSSFTTLLGQGSPAIRASATAQVAMQGPMRGMLPLAFMRDQFTVGNNFEVKFDGTAGGNRGAVAPNMGSSCGGASGANDFRNLIGGSASGGSDACASPIGSVIDTEPGNMSGPSRQGFDDRIGSNSERFTDVFRLDVATNTWTVLSPASPRIGIIPVVEQTNGSNTWPSGRRQVRIVSYMLCYIGKTDTTGNPAYTDNGRSVWVTPVQAILPEDFPYAGDNVLAYDPTRPAPLIFRMTV